MTSTYENPNSIEEKSLEEGVKIRSVENIMETYDVLLVHGIHPTFIPDANSILKAGTTWKDKLKIFLTLQPDISASTISRDDTAENIWSRIGVILAGGEITQASPYDSATAPTEILGDRSNLTADKDIEEHIKNAIQNRRPNTYNELVVKSPVAVALYWDSDMKGQKDRVPYEDLQKFSEEIGLPLFVLNRGRLVDHQGQKNSKTGRFDEISKDRLLELPRGLQPEKKEAVLNELYGSDSPFKLEKVKDGKAVSGEGYGRMAYMELVCSAGKNLRSAGKQEAVTFQGQMLNEVGDFPVMGKRIKYLTDDSGRVYRWEKELGEKEEDIKPMVGPSEIVRSLNEGKYLWLSKDETMKIGGRIDSPEEYVKKLQSELLSLGDKKEKADKKYGQWYSDYLRRVAFHLHGFAMQAQEMGDMETYNLAKGIAEKVVEEDDFTNVLHTRLDSDGGFHIVKDDLKLGGV